MSHLENLTQDQLFTIIDSTSLKELHMEFGEETQLAVVKEAMAWSADKDIPRTGTLNKKTEEIISASVNASSWPMSTLYVLLSIASTSILTTLAPIAIPLMVSISAATLVFFIINLFINYSQTKSENKKISKQFELGILKLYAAEALIHQQDPEATLNYKLNGTLPPVKTSKIKNSVMLLKSGGYIALTAAILFSNYAAAIYCLPLLGLATAATVMSGPIALGIVGGIAVCFGIAVGVMAYRSHQKNKAIKRKLFELNRKSDLACKQCYKTEMTLNTQAIKPEVMTPTSVVSSKKQRRSLAHKITLFASKQSVCNPKAYPKLLSGFGFLQPNMARVRVRQASPASRSKAGYAR